MNLKVVNGTETHIDTTPNLSNKTAKLRYDNNSVKVQSQIKKNQNA